MALGAGLVAVALLSGGGGASAAPGGGGFDLAQVTTIPPPGGVTYVTAPSGDGTRLFIVLQQGSIRLFKNGALLPDPFLTISPSCCGERGLLSMAFAPDYVISGLFYIYYTAPGPARSRSTSTSGLTRIPTSPIRHRGGM